MIKFSGTIDLNNLKNDLKTEVVESSSEYTVKSNACTLHSSSFTALGNKQNYAIDNDRGIIVIVYGFIYNKEKNRHIDLIELISDYLKSPALFLNKYSGTFALVLINRIDKKVILAKDVIGMLHLYYKFENGVVTYSNRPADLRTLNEPIDNNEVALLILTNYNSPAGTVYKNIKRVNHESIVVFSEAGERISNYYDIFDAIFDEHVIEKNFGEEAEIFSNLLNLYPIQNRKTTLTSGFDSRLLFAGLLYNNLSIETFTFGVSGNYEDEIAQEISSALNITHESISLDNFGNEISNYHSFIEETGLFEVNPERYHYINIFSKLQSENPEKIIHTGICGDVYLRNHFVTSNQTNRLLVDLITTVNKRKLISDTVIKNLKSLNVIELTNKNAEDLLNYEFEPIKDSNPHQNSLTIKFDYSMRRYFAAELSLENLFIPTFSPYTDKTWFDLQLKNPISVINTNYINAGIMKKLNSQKYYAELINLLFPKLNQFPSNRGYAPGKLLSKFNYPFLMAEYHDYKSKVKVNDLDYPNWKKTKPEILSRNSILQLLGIN